MLVIASLTQLMSHSGILLDFKGTGPIFKKVVKVVKYKKNLYIKKGVYSACLGMTTWK